MKKLSFSNLSQFSNIHGSQYSSFLLGIYNTEIGYGPLTLIFQIIVIIPSISLTSRRLQDRGISGWWQLLQLTIIAIPVLIIIFMLPAKEDENKWGRNPLLD